MGISALVCSNCGKTLTSADKFCAQCGTRVEDTAAVASPSACEICGHVNTAGGQFCEACGANLSKGSSSGKKSGEKKAPAKTASKKPGESIFAGFKFQPWHYVAGALLLGLIGFFVYTELEREVPAADMQSPMMQFPASQAPSTPPSKDVLDAIARLEKTVKDNPGDMGAKLLFANALHDGAMHDGSFFPRAIEAYKSYLKTKPGDPNARVDLGICYFELGKIDSTQSATMFSKAIDEMEAAAKSTPSHQAAAFNLGIVYLYSGNMKESNKWLQKTIELNSESDLGKRAKAILDQHNQAG